MKNGKEFYYTKGRRGTAGFPQVPGFPANAWSCAAFEFPANVIQIPTL